MGLRLRCEQTMTQTLDFRTPSLVLLLHDWIGGSDTLDFDCNPSANYLEGYCCVSW